MHFQNLYFNTEMLWINYPQLKTLELWISRSMLKWTVKEKKKGGIGGNLRTSGNELNCYTIKPNYIFIYKRFGIRF